MKTLLALFFLCAIPMVHASSLTGKIRYIQATTAGGHDNVLIIDFNTIASGRPACATDGTGKMAMSLESDKGKAILSIALLAETTGREVAVVGEGQCIGDMEVMRSMRTVEQ